MRFNKGAPDNDPLTEKHIWFAWYPVTVYSSNNSTGKEQTVWLEKVYRRKLYYRPMFSKDYYWMYFDTK